MGWKYLVVVQQPPVISEGTFTHTTSTHLIEANTPEEAVAQLKGPAGQVAWVVPREGTHQFVRNASTLADKVQLAWYRLRRYDANLLAMGGLRPEHELGCKSHKGGRCTCEVVRLHRGSCDLLQGGYGCTCGVREVPPA